MSGIKITGQDISQMLGSDQGKALAIKADLDTLIKRVEKRCDSSNDNRDHWTHVIVLLSTASTELTKIK
jgi:hypothetical protein